MGQQIDLKAIPNQRVSAVLGESHYELTLQDLGNCMGVTIVRDGVEIISVARALPNVPILPYDYQAQNAGGNFMFVTTGEDYPYWDKFESTDQLVFGDLAEIAALKAAIPDPRLSLGKTKVDVIRFPVVATMEPIGLGVTGDTQTVFKLKYKGAQVVSVSGTPVFQVRNADGTIKPLEPVTNYMWPTHIVPPLVAGAQTGWQPLRTDLIPPTTINYNEADPFGGNEAFSFTASSGSGTTNQYFYYSRVLAATPGPMCFSAWMKLSAPGSITMQPFSGTKIIPLTTEWQRVSATFTSTATGRNFWILPPYVDGSPPTPTFYMYGPQVNPGSTPGDFVPTTTGPATGGNIATFDGTVTVTLAAPLAEGQQLLWSGNAVINFNP